MTVRNASALTVLVDPLNQRATAQPNQDATVSHVALNAYESGSKQELVQAPDMSLGESVPGKAHPGQGTPG